MFRRLGGRKGISLSLVGLLIVGLIIAYLFIKVMTTYLGSSIKGSGDLAGSTAVSVVPTVSGGSAAPAQGVLEWTRQEVNAAGQLGLEREKEFAEMKF